MALRTYNRQARIEFLGGIHTRPDYPSSSPPSLAPAETWRPNGDGHGNLNCPSRLGEAGGGGALVGQRGKLFFFAHVLLYAPHREKKGAAENLFARISSLRSARDLCPLPFRNPPAIREDEDEGEGLLGSHISPTFPPFLLTAPLLRCLDGGIGWVVGRVLFLPPSSLPGDGEGLGCFFEVEMEGKGLRRQPPGAFFCPGKMLRDRSSVLLLIGLAD